MDSNNRLILTVGICIALLLGFQWLAPQLGLVPAPAPVAEEGAAGSPAQAGEAAAGAEPKAAEDAGVGAADEAGAAPERLPAQEALLPERQAKLRSDDLELGFSSHGAGIFRAELLGRKGQRQGGAEAPQVDLAEGLTAADPLLFELDLGEGFAAPLGTRAPCRLGAHDEESVTFLCSAGTVAVEKKFRLTGARTLDLEVNLRNLGSAPVGGQLRLVVPARIDPARQAKGGGCAGLGGPPPQPTKAICRHGDDKVTHHMYESDTPSVTPAGSAFFAGIEERYFLAVAVPDRASTCQLTGPNPETLITYLDTATGPIAPGASLSTGYQLVIGQKDMGFLQEASAQIAGEAKIANPRLEETVDLGFWAVIARVLLWLLRAFHLVIPNWGVSIILLTVFVKLVTLPLAWKSMKSMEEMRKLAPEIAALKKKFGDDREKLNVETMKLYQQHKVNPLGGCLPMLIQMPIWLALYTTLQTSVELYNEPFIAGWISDLTSKDPYYALPLVMGVTMFITQRMQPMQMDATQQKIMLYMMPIFFTFIMLQLPAGLTLYIFVNNLLSIAQQMVLRKQMGLPAIGAPPVAASQATIEVKPSKKPKKDS